MKEYAGAYHKGPVDGEFSGYVQRYSKDFSAEEQKYADQYSQDRITQAKKLEEDYAGSYGHKFIQPSLLAAMPAQEQNTSARGQNFTELAAAALAAQREASERAEAVIGELHRWTAKLRQDLRSEAFAAAVAQGIVTRAQTTFASERQELRRNYSAALEALDPRALAMADASDVKKAEHAAEAVLKEYRRVDHAEAKAMRTTLHSIEKAGKAKARTLLKQARGAARQVRRSGVAAARAQRKAGVPERKCERAEDDAESESERLSERAEEAAERAEGLAEEQSGKVEGRLERMMDALQDGEQAVDRRARRQRLHSAERLVHEARRAAQERAKEERVAQEKAAREARRAREKEAAEKSAAPEEAEKAPEKKAEKAPEEEAAEKSAAPEKATSEPEAEPSVFLARSSSRDAGALVAPLACFLAMSTAISLLVLRPCRQTAAVEHPLLG